jgi:hypothetical protein
MIHIKYLIKASHHIEKKENRTTPRGKKITQVIYIRTKFSAKAKLE